MIVDRCRNVEELRNLYETRPMPIQYEWDFLINNPNLFCFYAEDGEKELRGFITVQIEEGELTLSGASVRKNMADNINAIISVCNEFKQDMYSYTTKREAKLVLKLAGFREIEQGKFLRRYQNG